MNPIDAYIVLHAFGSFLFFWVLHVFLFRFMKPERVFRWPITFYVLAAILSILIFDILAGDSFPYHVDNLFTLNIPILLFSTLLYTFFTFLYIFGIFGMIESSLRVRLLRLIAQTGERGVSARQIKEKYNTDTIVRKRLLRLTGSGILQIKNGRYRIRQPHSFLLLHHKILFQLDRLYNK